MRVTNEMTYRLMTKYLSQHQDSVYDLQERISTGKQMLKPSDNPGSYDLLMRLYGDKACFDQFVRNTERLEQDLLTTDTVLQNITDSLHRISEIIVSTSDGTMSPSYQEAASEEIDLMLEQLVEMANTKLNGRYIFAGLRTDAAPYAVTRDALGHITGVTFEGNSEIRQVEIAKGVYTSANIPGTNMNGGEAVFQTQTMDLFNDMIQLRDRLLAGENLVEPEAFTADAATDTLTVANIYHTGSLVRLTTETGTVPAGLSADRDYFAIVISPTEIQLANTLEDARNGIAIDFTDAGSGEVGIKQQSLAENERDLDQVLTMLSAVGAREERIETNLNFLRDMQLQNLQTIDVEEALDITKAVTELSEKKLAYEASLRVTTTLMDVSLLNLI
ncbi:MAG: flagellar hook-associated protein 3 [Spartobacteria bacterium]|nr:flagellar hook-associated protein 3 [Spartobacteria bacterium]